MPMDRSMDVPTADIPIICPACHTSDYADTHLDADMHRCVVHEAGYLVHDGRRDEAIELLIALYARHIANFVQPRWHCLACGVRFDG